MKIRVMDLLSYIIVFIGIIYTGSNAMAARKSCTHTDTQFNCVKYVKNYDGDTITFNIPKVHVLLGSEIGVRVLDLDTPEMKSSNECEKKAAVKAQQLVENALKNASRIELRNVSRDKYFRIDADVFYDGKNLKDLIMESKLAYAYDGGTKSKVDWCPLVK